MHWQHGMDGYALRIDHGLRLRRAATSQKEGRESDEQEVAPYVFTGIQILHPRLFKEVPTGAFSLNLLYDRAEAAGRLYAIVHDGEWFHIGTPDGLADAEAELSGRSRTTDLRTRR